MPCVNVPCSPEELDKLYSADRIPEGGVRGVIAAGGRFYVVTGGFHCNGQARQEGQECVPLANYRGTIPPCSYEEKSRLIMEAEAADGERWALGIKPQDGMDYTPYTRSRFYAGITFKSAGREWIFLDVEHVALRPRAEGTKPQQLTLGL